MGITLILSNARLVCNLKLELSGTIKALITLSSKHEFVTTDYIILSEIC